MPVEGFIFYLAVIWIGAMIVVGLDWLFDRMLDRSVARPRTDTRLPRREYELLGDDYRDAVADYFARKAERDERSQRAFRAV